MTERTHVHVEDATDTDTETSCSFMRVWAGALVIAGVMLAGTPLMPIGVISLVVGVLIWLVSFAVEPVEQRALDEAEQSGGGCGWLAVAGLMIIVAGVAFLAVAGAVLGGV